MFLNFLFSALFVLLLVGVVLVILFEEGDSGRKAAWLLIITILPVIGLVLYLMVGISYRYRWLYRIFHKPWLEAQAQLPEGRLKELFEGERSLASVQEHWRSLVPLLATDDANTVCGGNDVEIITDGRRKYDLLVRDLLAAKEYIHVEYYLFGKDPWSDGIRRILMQKAREGVKVRFIHENIVNFDLCGKYWKEMADAGIEVLPFTNPRRHLLNFVTRLNYRDHRKIVVIDGRTGYCGGMNIKARYFEGWRDTHLRVTGDAVLSLQSSFLSTWMTAGGTIDREYGQFFPETGDAAALPEPGAEFRPARPGADGTVVPHPVLKEVLVQVVPDEADNRWPITQMGYVRAISLAREYIWLQTPYFVPTEPVLEALKAAALSGVDVRLMVPFRTDAPLMGPVNESFFSECLAAGIRIFRWKGGTFIHAKTFVCDDYLTMVGSANIDYRSFMINHEINTFLYDRPAALQYKSIFLEDQEVSEEVTWDRWTQRSWFRKLRERIFRLFAPLL